MDTNEKRSFPRTRKEVNISSGEMARSYIYSDRSINDPCNAWLLGGVCSKKQRNRYDIHIKSSHDLKGFTKRNPSRMNSGFAYVRIQIQNVRKR